MTAGGQKKCIIEQVGQAERALAAGIHRIQSESGSKILDPELSHPIASLNSHRRTSPWPKIYFPAEEWRNVEKANQIEHSELVIEIFWFNCRMYTSFALHNLVTNDVQKGHNRTTSFRFWKVFGRNSGAPDQALSKFGISSSPGASEGTNTVVWPDITLLA
ncbi:hypothetical protein R3P38DRAFT_2796192 [Favolaschia claudopus]|uniref:Uncharacterized protein n=1 Tax=Favolaschia claudopus TaxID=2862362 RepID=A0AAW0A560_9AGAR